MVSVTLTVFFEDPFWVGLFERVERGALTVSRHVFGAQPSDREVYEWLAAVYPALRFSPPVEGASLRPAAANPKRRQRQAARMLDAAIGTKSQQALAAAREESKSARRQRQKARNEAEEARRFALRQDKKKAKHRGR